MYIINLLFSLPFSVSGLTSFDVFKHKKLVKGLGAGGDCKGQNCKSCLLFYADWRHVRAPEIATGKSCLYNFQTTARRLCELMNTWFVCDSYWNLVCYVFGSYLPYSTQLNLVYMYTWFNLDYTVIFERDPNHFIFMYIYTLSHFNF